MMASTHGFAVATATILLVATFSSAQSSELRAQLPHAQTGEVRERVARDDATPTVEPTLPEMPEGTGCPPNSVASREWTPVEDPVVPTNIMFTCKCDVGFQCQTAESNGQDMSCQFFNALGVVEESSTHFLCFGRTIDTCHAQLFKCAGPPTPEPTPAPTPPPSPAPTPEPSPSPTPQQQTDCCGGGTCDQDGACTSCGNAERVLAAGKVDGERFGKCIPVLYCKGNKITQGGLEGFPCSCDTSKCAYCVVKPDGETCRKCKNGFYFLDGECVQDCPSEYTSAGINLVGRKCLSPFTCKNGKSTTDQLPCKCTSIGNTGGSNCHTCEFEAGGYGQKCTRCSDGKFLNTETNVCEDDCSGMTDPSNTVSYTVGLFGSMCTDPFVCIDRKIDNADGTKCKCSKAIGGTSCVACDWSLTGNTCHVCGNAQYLLDGACVTDCGDKIKSGTGPKGRECVDR